MHLVGISGPSCSGKSTLARHLRLVLPHAGILYEDDFYLPESLLPPDEFGDPNWDCPHSFDLPKLRSTLQQLRTKNELPSQNTREDANNVADLLLSPEQLRQLRQKFAHLTDPVVFVDGILLYNPEIDIDEYLSLKLLVPFNYAELKQRRALRTTYTTVDGQWTDPPHFFERVVWPEFVKHGGSLYAPENQQYAKLSPTAERAGIWLTPDLVDMYAAICAVIAELVSRGIVTN